MSQNPEDLPDFLQSKICVDEPRKPKRRYQQKSGKLDWNDIVISQEKPLGSDMVYIEVSCVFSERCEKRCTWSFNSRTALPFAEGVKLAKRYSSLCERTVEEVNGLRNGAFILTSVVTKEPS